MLTLCWGAKGGSGTTVVAASLAGASSRPTLLVDLDGDLPTAFGIPEPSGPGLGDWLASDAPPARLDALAIPLRPGLDLLPIGRGPLTGPRWPEAAHALAARPHDVVIDAGTGSPPPALHAVADRSWLVMRACYLAVRRAGSQPLRPDGIVLIEEPGRSLSGADLEHTIGAPIVARILLDPAIARAVDSGLLVSRLPRPFRRVLEDAA